MALPNATASSGLKYAYDQNYANFFNNTGKTKVSEAQLTLNGATVYENVYTSSEEGVAKKYRAVWLQKGSTIYVILCSARTEAYDSQRHQLLEGTPPPPADAVVAETIATGYMFQGKLVRPALVRLRDTPTPAVPPTSEEADTQQDQLPLETGPQSPG